MQLSAPGMEVLAVGNDSQVRKWLLSFILFDLVVFGLFLGIRAVCRRRMQEGGLEEVTITKKAS